MFFVPELKENKVLFSNLQLARNPDKFNLGEGDVADKGEIRLQCTVQVSTTTISVNVK